MADAQETWLEQLGGTISFSILRRGASEAGGPYTEEEILDLLSEEAISRKDYVFFEGMDDWQPIEEVFEIHEQINNSVDDGQDHHHLTDAHREVSKVLSAGEEIYYIAIQAKSGILSRTRQCLVVSSQHLFHLTEKKSGFEIEAHDWASVVQFKGSEEPADLGVFEFSLRGERDVDVSNLPIQQVHRLVELCSELSV